MFPDLRPVLKAEYGNIYHVNVVQGGRSRFQWSKKGFDTKVRTVRSVTKSVTASLIGIALQQGLIESLDQPLTDFFPDMMDRDSNQAKASITVKHLLTMTSGVDCHEGATNGFFKSPDWTRFFLQQKMAFSPGSTYRYSSAGSHVLSSLITRVSGQNAASFAGQHLFAPLGIRKYDWAADKQGNNHGGFGLKLAPDSLMKFGLLYLHGGNWQGRQLLDKAYIAAATQQHIHGQFPENDGYGYQWWISRNRDIPYFYAAGMGGQYVFVIPALNAVAVITSNATRIGIKHKSLFTGHILPALKKA